MFVLDECMPQASKDTTEPLAHLNSSLRQLSLRRNMEFKLKVKHDEVGLSLLYLTYYFYCINVTLQFHGKFGNARDNGVDNPNIYSLRED